MESWFKITRPDWIVQNEFRAAWLQAHGPVGAALFCERLIRERTNVFYLTPEAAKIAPILIARFGGVPCDAPDLSHSSLRGPFLLEGDQSIIEGNDY